MLSWRGGSRQIPRACLDSEPNLINNPGIIERSHFKQQGLALEEQHLRLAYIPDTHIRSNAYVPVHMHLYPHCWNYWHTGSCLAFYTGVVVSNSVPQVLLLARTHCAISSALKDGSYSQENILHSMYRVFHELCCCRHISHSICRRLL